MNDLLTIANSPNYVKAQQALRELALEYQTESKRQTIGEIQYHMIKLQTFSYYLKSLHRVDHQMGRVLAALEIIVDELIEEHGGGL